MNPDIPRITPEACKAHLLRGVINATAPADETRTEAAARCELIVEMFKCLAPDNALQAMIACHCIMLRFVLEGAMRDAANQSLEPKILARARSSAMTISRQWDVWSNRFDKMKARDETEAAKALAGEQSATTAARKPAPKAPPPAGPTVSVDTPPDARAAAQEPISEPSETAIARASHDGKVEPVAPPRAAPTPGTFSSPSMARHETALVMPPIAQTSFASPQARRTG